MPRSRLAPEVFALPVDRLREGYYTDAYFNGAKRVLETKDLHPRVTMQVFQKTDGAVLGGMDEALAILRLCTGRYVAEGGERVWVDGWDHLDVRALYDGDELSGWETVLTIEGDYALFAHLETVYLGVLIAAHAHQHQRAPRRRRRARQADPLLPGALRPLPGADRRRVRRPRRRRHRREHRRAGVLVGRQGHRHGAARAHRRVRRRHRRGGGGVRRRPLPRDQRHGAGRLGQRLRRHQPRLRAGARRAPLGRPPRHERDHGRPLALGRHGRVPPQRGGAGARPRRAPRARRRGVPARQHRRQRRLRRRAHPALRGGRRTGGRLRRRQQPAARQHRLHRRRRAAGGPALRQGRPALPARTRASSA